MCPTFGYNKAPEPKDILSIINVPYIHANSMSPLSWMDYLKEQEIKMNIWLVILHIWD